MLEPKLLELRLDQRPLGQRRRGLRDVVGSAGVLLMPAIDLAAGCFQIAGKAIALQGGIVNCLPHCCKLTTGTLRGPFKLSDRRPGPGASIPLIFQLVRRHAGSGRCRCALIAQLLNAPLGLLTYFGRRPLPAIALDRGEGQIMSQRVDLRSSLPDSLLLLVEGIAEAGFIGAAFRLAFEHGGGALISQALRFLGSTAGEGESLLERGKRLFRGRKSPGRLASLFHRPDPLHLQLRRLLLVPDHRRLHARLQRVAIGFSARKIFPQWTFVTRCTYFAGVGFRR